MHQDPGVVLPCGVEPRPPRAYAEPAVAASIATEAPTVGGTSPEIENDGMRPADWTRTAEPASMAPPPRFGILDGLEANAWKIQCQGAPDLVATCTAHEGDRGDHSGHYPGGDPGTQSRPSLCAHETGAFLIRTT